MISLFLFLKYSYPPLVSHHVIIPSKILKDSHRKFSTISFFACTSSIQKSAFLLSPFLANHRNKIPYMGRQG